MAAKKKRKRRKPQNNLLVLRLLILVVLVLAVFEGRLIVTMFTHSRGGAPEVAAEADGQNLEETEKEPETQTQAPISPLPPVLWRTLLWPVFPHGLKAAKKIRRPRLKQRIWTTAGFPR